MRPRDLDDQERRQLLDGSADRGVIRTSLEKIGLEVDEAMLDGLLEEGHDHAERRALEDSQRTLVESLCRPLGAPIYELPRLPGGVDMAGLYELAELLSVEGLA